MSVRYCRTSVPPVFSMWTPFMVLGIELVAIVLVVDLAKLNLRVEVRMLAR
jgi:hypothetical protein